MQFFKMPIDTVFSIIEEIIKTIIINPEMAVCLIISNFIFSFLLSFIIDLYNFILLTPKVKTAGINNIFCRNIDDKQNNIPFIFPNVIVIAEIVYHKTMPLNSIIAKTIGMPIIVVPAPHNIIAKIILSFMESIIIFPLSMFSIVLNFNINSFI